MKERVVFNCENRGSEPVTIPDANFQAVIEEAWLNPNGTPITEVEMFALTELSVPGADIRDLTRLEFTLNLTFFGLTVQL